MDKLIPLFMAIPIGSAFIIYLIGSILKARSRRFADIWSLLAVLILLLFSIYFLFQASFRSPILFFMGSWRPPIGITLVLDGLSCFILLIINFIALMAVLFSIDYMEKFTAKYKFYALLMLLIGGMNGIAMTGDLFNFYVFLEISAIASYVLVSFGVDSMELEAAFKYMVLASIGSIFILLSIALLYARTGTLNMADISQTLANNPNAPFLILISVLFIIGFGLKAALVPFHAWLPDAHPSAPAPISAMLSGVVIKVLGAYGLVRIFYNVLGMSHSVSLIILILSGLSMLIGVILQLGQTDIKRLLAYCSISQIGYVLLGLGLGTPLGILGGLFHLLNHAVFKSLLFFNSGAVEYETHTRDITKMGGISQKMPITSLSWFIGSFSASGVPPFNGFWSKLILIIAAVQAQHYVLAGIAGIAAILTLTSFVKVQRQAFLGSLPEHLAKIKEVPITMTATLIILTALCVSMGIMLIPSIRQIVLDSAQNAILIGTDYAKIVFERALQ
ncbi:MAG: proton-conducting transporter membrane subunit [candidate division WOR-3 bacterium]|nr:proton-conducting transporter membrane subunit [candidate division WOR-3 bacterium]